MKITWIHVFSILILLACSIFVDAQEAYKDPSLSFEVRVEDLLKRLTLEEKITLMQDVSQPIERLNIKTYNWWNEALHGIARTGIATVYPQPIGMAAAFDQNAVFNVFNAVSDEGRAKNTCYSAQGEYGRYQGLTMWTPTINIYRDPRWGRGIETYGEDPYLTSVLGVAAVKGLQGPADRKYDKLHACAKHFAVHSGPEWNRHSFDAKDIKPRHLWETYFPAFEALIKDAGVKEVMCAYNRFEGQPCCGSNQLLIQILREKWGFQGVVVADCGAIRDFYNEGAHETHTDAASASAHAVLSGTDLDCGSSYKALAESVHQGFITELAIDVSVRRLLLARFQLGEMDDDSQVSWTKIPYDVVASRAHDSLALDIARKSMTLLLNKNGTLPLKRGGLTVAVVGPNAHDSIMQWGNYNGTPAATITILDGIKAALGKTDKLIYERGSGLVETTLLESVFNQCRSKGGPGFSARYWNNLKRNGQPDVSTRVTAPFNFCTMGATVFAPGVVLTDFSARYNTVFVPEKSGEVFFDFYVNGIVNLLIDNKEVKGVKANHGSRKMSHGLKVEAGKPYDIQIDFTYNRGDAQLLFDFGYKEEINIAKTVEKVKDADVVVFVGGISPSLEGEEMGVNLPGFKGGDRTDIELPAVQRALIKALKNAGKKVVLVNCSGSPIGLEPEIENCEAILQAWYPGQSGGTAVAEVLFGDYNPAGRLPVTFYKNVQQLPDFENYDMEGRTYRYMDEAPLFPFGHGLSYTTFVYGKPRVDKKKIKVGEHIKLRIPVTNTGKINGEEVVQVYLRKNGDVDGPSKTLRAFKRTVISAGQTVAVEFELSAKEFQWWNEASQSMDVSAGEFTVFVGGSSENERLATIEVALK
ncbi:glycoside hydrolase family 3 protein [Sphingobacterium olei]|uniref:Glycoside hydrolase family 3 protein n=1 Tax=Sphingobacterium olei TaxID=2571155 RepID=A0A4U0P3A0_9SPHI|nr:xylan 1,4-beta-xylosidase [Sphingobacterium olei]TJZ61765.1 glycoside hydrolase family 3 protein [Sphingobacterium olei]